VVIVKILSETQSGDGGSGKDSKFKRVWFMHLTFEARWGLAIQRRMK
jgi:hypothetical protein